MACIIIAVRVAIAVSNIGSILKRNMLRLVSDVFQSPFDMTSSRVLNPKVQLTKRLYDGRRSIECGVCGEPLITGPSSALASGRHT